MTHPTSYLVLPELTPDAIRAGATRAAEAPDETLAVALTLLVSNALGRHPPEQAIRDAWHDRPFEGASDAGLQPCEQAETDLLYAAAR